MQWCNRCFLDHYKIVDLLIRNGANVNLPHRENRTALHLASRNGKYKLCETPICSMKFAFNLIQVSTRLLICSSKIMWMWTSGINSIEQLCRSQLRVASWLIFASTSSRLGKYHIYVYWKLGNNKIAILLIRNGADVNLADDKGRSPLQRSVQKSNWLFSNGMVSHLTITKCQLH